MQRAARLAIACNFCCILDGCGSEHARRARTLDITALEPTWVEPGSRLQVTGTGFPPRAPCELTFDGWIQPPGAARKQISTQLEGSAASEHQVVLDLDDAGIAALGGQGTFSGALGLRCVRANQVAVSAPLQVRLDLFESSFRGSARERELVERARRFVDFAGIRSADSRGAMHGLVVAEIRPGSLAAAVRLAPGDTILEAGGVAVHSLRDLAPAVGTRAFSVRVRRMTRVRAETVVFTLAGFDAPEPPAALQRLGFLLALSLAAMCAIGSVRALAWRQLGTRERVDRVASSALGLWGGPLSTGPWTRLRRAVLPALTSAAGVWFLASAWVDFLALRSISLYFGFAALSTALTLMNGCGGLARRARSAAAMLGRMSVLGVLLACACALSGTRSLAGMAAEQGAWPWQWAGLQRPALLLAFPLYCAFAAELGAASLQLGAGSARGPRSRGWLRRLLESSVIAERVFTNVALCVLGVVVFAGGWQSPDELAGLLPACALGGSLFVLKAWALAGVLATARRQCWARRLRRRGSALGCLATIGLTALWLWLDPKLALELELVFGRALAIAVLCLGLWFALERRVCAWFAALLAREAGPRPRHSSRARSAASAASAAERYP
jgi:hypothetical protein